MKAQAAVKLEPELSVAQWLLPSGSGSAIMSGRRRRQRSYAASLILQAGLMSSLVWGLSSWRQIQMVPMVSAESDPVLTLLAPAVLYSPPPTKPLVRAWLPRLRPAPPRLVTPPRLVSTPRVLPQAVSAPAADPPPSTPLRPVVVAVPAPPPLPLPVLAPAPALAHFGARDGITPQPAAPLPVPQLGSFGAALDPTPPSATAAGQITQSGFGPAGTAITPATETEGSAIQSAGFGAPVPAATGASLGGGVHLNAFAAPQPPAATVAPQLPPAPAFTLPRVEGWPQPVYTAAALAHRIEGEVVLEVRLGADGHPQVVRVVSGLPDGLDDAAAAAVAALRYTPALRAGMPVDWTVRVHVQFRLAY